jgi:hypothetical protein
VGPALRLSCRSELHVLPQFPVAQTIRSPDYDELSGPHRCLQSGPACYGFVCHPGISPLSRYGIQLALVLPSVLPVMSLQTSCGLHRFEPVVGAVLPPSWAMLLTRQGISLAPYLRVRAEMHYLTWAKQRVPFTLLLHVAMQMGLYLHRRAASSSSVFGV